MSISNMKFSQAMQVINTLAIAHPEKGDKFAVARAPGIPASTLVISEGGSGQGMARTFSRIFGGPNPDFNAVVTKIAKVLEYLETETNLRNLCTKNEVNTEVFTKAENSLYALGDAYNHGRRSADVAACWGVAKRIADLVKTKLNGSELPEGSGAGGTHRTPTAFLQADLLGDAGAAGAGDAGLEFNESHFGVL